MTMIGLFTGASPVTAASAPSDDQGAEGFGSALQDVLSSLAGRSAGLATPEVMNEITGEETQADAADSSAETLALGAASPSGLVASAETQFGSSPWLAQAASAPLVEPAGSTPSSVASPAVPSDLSDPSPSAVVASSARVATGPGADIIAEPSATSAAVLDPDEAPPSHFAPAEADRSPGSSRVAPASTIVPTAGGSPVAAGSAIPVVDTGVAPSGSALPPAAVPPASEFVSQAPAARPDDTAVSLTGRMSPGPVNSAGQPDTTIGTVQAGAANSNRESASTLIPQPAAAPIGTPVPTGTVAPVAPASAPAAAAAVPFPTQLSRPIFSLVSAGTGEHVMTISVTPENLGPVTVRAHVGANGVRVELFAPSELGREAIRAILPDLRRDLAGAGLGGTLDLSARDQPSDKFGFGAHNFDRGQPEAGQGEASLGRGADEPVAEPERPNPGLHRARSAGTASTIDVLA